MTPSCKLSSKILSSTSQSQGPNTTQSFLPSVVCTEDVEGDLPLGSPCLRFWIIQQQDQGICLVLRISHAQYDGIGMPVILQDLHALYEQAPMPPAQPFSTYINSRIHAADAQCKEYWRNLLKGSSMTPLPSQQREQAALTLEGDQGPAVNLKAAVPIPKVRPGVTLATLVSVALALVISRTTSRSDIVFGQLTSGRNLPVPSIDKIVGACINTVPIRLQLPPGKTVSELLSELQDQKIASAPFESYGLTEIVENCVEWPTKTKFHWTVQHQNIEGVRSLSLGDEDSKFEYFAPHLGGAMEDVVWLYTESVQNELQIVLTGREFRKGFLEQVLEDLRTILAQGG